MRVWKKCGHPRTSENTAQIKPSTQPKGSCKLCHLAAQKKYDRSDKGRARNRNCVARYSVTAKGVFTAARTLLNRRISEHTNRLQELEAALNG